MLGQRQLAAKRMVRSFITQVVLTSSAKYHPARRTLVEAEKTQSENVTARKGAEDRLKIAEQRLRELEVKLDEEGRESSEVTISRQRLSEELEDERQQHQKDLAERDFTADQTRKKYQGKPQKQMSKFRILTSFTLSRTSTTERR